jgi:choline dehydrogenase-like flavoprotein
MIVSGETLEDGGTTQADVAIVGAGPVGVAIAIRLAGRAGRVVLIEAGGARYKRADNLNFFRAERVDDRRHAPAELNRRRMLGGTSSVWGGRCIPFDPEDFQPTSVRPGWPIAFAEFEAHVADALEFLDVGPPEFSAAAVLPNHYFPSTSSSALVLDRIERYSKPTNAWRKWRDHLDRSRDVTVIHGAACTEVLTDSDGARAVALELGTVSQRRHKIVAGTIVLACGGLETPRLLLASRRTHSCGLGNGRDLVGRFYMTHLVSSAENAGILRLAEATTARAFDYSKTTDGAYGRRMILLSPEVRRREGLPNIVFRPNRPAIDDASHRNSVLSMMFLVRSLLIPAEYLRSLTTEQGTSVLQAWRQHGRNIVADIPGLAQFTSKWLTQRVLPNRKLPSVFLYRKDGQYPLEFNAEQMPNRDSRVMLGSEMDSLGMPRLVVQWQYQNSELDAICRAYRVLASAVAESGLGEVELGPDLLDSVQRALVPQGGHHIGTVRMSDSVSSGVIDPNGEVWDCRGLFVAGTAVLPTSGFANPTLTAVALAFRLAEWLVLRDRGTGVVCSST